jgi:N-formylglutamate amidohydrolase
MKTILHIPHASTVIPEDCLKDFCISNDEITRELLRMTDSYTNELYISDDPKVYRVETMFSRLCCDVERFREDEGEEMSKIGMGAIYTHGSYMQRIKNITTARREELLSTYYDPHHKKLYDAVTLALSEEQGCLIVDCHSFQTLARPYEVDALRQRPQIGIGTHPTHTPPQVTDLISKWAVLHGYSFALSEPYAGTIVPLPYFEKDIRVKSVMLEIRRDLYMNETTGTKNKNFDLICKEVQQLIGQLSVL